ncbi:hypothetical protein PVL29_005961 [Vitis rotundifolia]|uniref:CRC domain-containing protein n=2 Tax=Vitis rotundifolia TaxID=103349 RepID=A0AA39A3Q9_VITRO|nr:hypothetical protein PVL29_005961 [Vitis rotundifolia]
MDTPERNQIAAPISKFEDSPVFNFINSLSPIKPVKSANIAQTFNSLSFVSLPSIFTSPHVSSHKESRFLRRHNFSDPSKPEFSSVNGNKVSTNEEVMDANQLCGNSGKPLEDFDPRSSIGKASFEPNNGHSELAIELPQTLKYGCGSPDCDPTPCGGTEVELASKSGSLAPFSEEASEIGRFNSQLHLKGMCQIEQKKEEAGCDWESLISDAADLLIFDSPDDTRAFKGLIQKSLDPGTSICASLGSQFSKDDVNDLQKKQFVGSDDSGEHETDDPSTQPEEASKLNGMDQKQENLANSSFKDCMGSNASGEMDNEGGTCIPVPSKTLSNLHRGMRRRCLVFEMAGVRRKNMDDGSNCSSSMLSQSDGTFVPNDKQLVPLKPGNDSSRRILPGIGLHLNALATTSKDYNVVKHETLTSGRQLISVPSSSGSYLSTIEGQEPVNKSLALNSSDRETDPAENGFQALEDASQASAYAISEELNQSSPKKKRRRLEHGGETEGCKRCNCKKSKCLKLYCECFAAGVYCVEPCSCQECFNKPIHEDTVLATRKQIESRNPLAFAPKVIRSSDSMPEVGDEPSKTPASARHKRGCNCKKSSCLKKYCECYQGGVGCSINCRCEGCKNAFGRKDGSALIGMEAELEEETETLEKSVVDKNLQKSIVQNDEEYLDSALPVTPLRTCRQSSQLSFPSKTKLARSSFLTIGSSSGLHTSQIFGKPNFPQPQSKFEKKFQTIPEDEMPEILRGNCSPTSSSIKTASPNSKRVSPPHCDFGSSPSRRSGRKLILQSIPSFPSLTPQH